MLNVISISMRTIAGNQYCSKKMSDIQIAIETINSNKLSSAISDATN